MQMNDDVYTRNGFAAVKAERDVDRLDIEGDWPEALCGSLYRIGPNPQFEPIVPYNPLLGDGMVHAFHIAGRRVSYLNRWVRTLQWELEHTAGRALFATSGDRRQNDPAVAGIATDGVANTNLVWHGGRLLALEEGHPPIELHPETLDTLGVWTFDGALPSNMCAHPKVDPRTGEMVFFANFPDGRFTGELAWYVASASGRLLRQGRIRTPYPALIHDFAVTRDFIVFIVCPVTVSIPRAMAGGPPLAWEPDLQTFAGVVRRDGTDGVRWFTRSSCFAWHVQNAWDDGDGISVELCEQASPAFPRTDGLMPDEGRRMQHLTRWELNRHRGDRVRHHVLHDQVCEYPRYDERFAMSQTRHGFFACHGGPGTADPFHRGIGHFDQHRERLSTFHLGARCAVSEPVFVPRSSGAPEGDGFVLCVVYDEAADRSALTLFDAQSIERGPVARAMLEHRVPMGFHGCWLPGKRRQD